MLCCLVSVSVSVFAVSHVAVSTVSVYTSSLLWNCLFNFVCLLAVFVIDWTDMISLGKLIGMIEKKCPRAVERVSE